MALSRDSQFVVILVGLQSKQIKMFGGKEYENCHLVLYAELKVKVNWQ